MMQPHQTMRLGHHNFNPKEFDMLADVSADNIGLLIFGGVMLFYMSSREGVVKKDPKDKLIIVLMRWPK